MNQRQKVLVFRELPPDQLARLQAEHEVVIANPKLPTQLAAFHAALKDADGMIGSSYPIHSALLAEASRLKVISSVSVGVDNYDLTALAAYDIMLCHTPGVLTETTADTIFALIMATSRRLVELALHVREGRWTRNIGEELFGHDVHGKLWASPVLAASARPWPGVRRWVLTCQCFTTAAGRLIWKLNCPNWLAK